MTNRDKLDSVFRHAPPHKHVLLLSCMDQRLLDDTVSFMDGYNLENRYDQVVFAGAALGVMHVSSPSVDCNSSNASAWKDVFFDHLRVAIDVLDRKIEDIFILEHRDCGAYHNLHPDPKLRKKYDDSDREQAMERRDHCDQAFALAKRIRAYCVEQQEQSEKVIKHSTCKVEIFKAEKRLETWKKIKVKCFLMDLQGNVEHLREPEAGTSKVTKQSKAKTS